MAKKEAKFTYWLLENTKHWYRQAFQLLPYDPNLAGTFKYTCKYRKEVELLGQYMEEYKPQIREYCEYSINIAKVVTKIVRLRHETWFTDYISVNKVIKPVKPVKEYMPAGFF
jgi:hypothetical protein